MDRVSQYKKIPLLKHTKNGYKIFLKFLQCNPPDNFESHTQTAAVVKTCPCSTHQLADHEALV